MSEFAIQILKNTPIWVWAILVFLIYFGVKQTADRDVKRYAVLFAPVGFFIFGLVSMRQSSLSLTTWLIAIKVVSAFTYLIWRPTGGARYESQGDVLRLAGSKAPLIFMVGMFLLNYALNVFLALNPAAKTDVLWQVVPALILGASTGLYVGRAATLFRMNRVRSSALAT